MRGENHNCEAPPAGSICHGLTQDPPAIGQVLFPVTGEYVFVLNEAEMTYDISVLGSTGTERESWGHIKSLFR